MEAKKQWIANVLGNASSHLKPHRQLCDRGGSHKTEFVYSHSKSGNQTSKTVLRSSGRSRALFVHRFFFQHGKLLSIFGSATTFKDGSVTFANTLPYKKQVSRTHTSQSLLGHTLYKSIRGYNASQRAFWNLHLTPNLNANAQTTPARASRIQYIQVNHPTLPVNVSSYPGTITYAGVLPKPTPSPVKSK